MISGDEQRKKNVLFIGAHPDDVVLGAACMIRWCIEQGGRYQPIIISCTPCYDVEGNDHIMDEWSATNQLLGVTVSDMGCLTNKHFYEEQDRLRIYFDELNAQYHPTCVFTHSGCTIHQDHRAVFEMARRVFRYAGLLGYHDVKSMPDFHPLVFLRTGLETIKLKQQCVALFESQKYVRYMQPDVILGLAQYFGALALNLDYDVVFEAIERMRKEELIKKEVKK